MQVSNSLEAGPVSLDNRQESRTTVNATASIDDSNDQETNTGSCGDDSHNGDGKPEDEPVIDVLNQNLEFSLLDKADDSVEGLYLYRNVFNLIPKAVGRLSRLKTLKFFGNEINLLPAELGNLGRLECLQVKVSSPGFNSGLSLTKLEGLKELELTKVPHRPSVLKMLSEIAALKCLTKLSVCHFSIRFVPPEIGCVKSLEYLDLSFNKIKSLPTEISYLKFLISLKVANNKLMELPSGLTALQRLENLDLSNNRLTSLGSLELGLMHNLQNLNLQYNKLLSYCQIPSWICCYLEGNGKDSSNDELVNSSVEMDVYEAFIPENDGSVFCNADGRRASFNASHSSSSILTETSSNSRCFSPRRSTKRWKRQQHYLQQRARQERLNNSRKWKGEGLSEGLNVKADGISKPCIEDVKTSKSSAEGASEVLGLDDDKQLVNVDAESENLGIDVEEKVRFRKGLYNEDGAENEYYECEASVAPSHGGAGTEDNGSSSETSKSIPKSKRHSDSYLDNPKPCKYQRPTKDSLILSHKYSNTSLCSIDDCLPDGFYDAGRDRPFMPLQSYEQILNLESREVILVDRERDEVLDAILLSAQALVFQLKQLNRSSKDRDQIFVDNLQIASLLALFVSDHFGGSDRSAIVERTRKAVSGSNYKKPFVCTCSTGNSDNISASTKQILDSVEDIIFADLCEKSLRSIKLRRNSIIVPIGSLQFGVCRHRALLMKYLCDRMEPPLPCELVRGYLDFLPHAWNIIPIKRGDSWVRMIVDACRPHDIREEEDIEYLCRYIPLTRVNASIAAKSSLDPGCYFPSLSACDETLRAASSSLIRCKVGSLEAAAKVRTLEVCGTSSEEVRDFEYNCLGEVRILGALKHSCIVELYGHQISSKWVPSADGNVEHRVLQSAILMEYVNGGSLKSHIEKLSKAGEKHLPMDLALWIAQDVASALSELHSKHIIHRDVKSENILIDLDEKRADGAPIVKLCDFDRAVPLRSFLHTCCIAHAGIPRPDVCVGTPRWMAPEVLQAMHTHSRYGLEVDIWSYGCLLFELLTLQVPYSGLSELHIHELLQIGKRPRLTDELEALGSLDEHAAVKVRTNLDLSEADVETLRFLIDVFRRCTQKNPTDRPTAGDLYEMLHSRSTNFMPSRSYKQL